MQPCRRPLRPISTTTASTSIGAATNSTPTTCRAGCWRWAWSADLQLESRGSTVPVKNLHGIERVFGEIAADIAELLDDVGRHRDHVAADVVGLPDVEELAAARPDHLHAAGRVARRHGVLHEGQGIAPGIGDAPG